MQIGQYASLEHGKDFYKDHFVVNSTFFNICNFSCSYCIPGLYNGSRKGFDLDVVKRFIDQIFENKKDKKIFFEFTGGEITFYQHFKELFSWRKDWPLKSVGSHWPCSRYLIVLSDPCLITNRKKSKFSKPRIFLGKKSLSGNFSSCGLPWVNEKSPC